MAGNAGSERTTIFTKWKLHKGKGCEGGMGWEWKWGRMNPSAGWWEWKRERKREMGKRKRENESVVVCAAAKGEKLRVGWPGMEMNEAVATVTLLRAKKHREFSVSCPWKRRRMKETFRTEWKSSLWMKKEKKIN